MQRHESDWRTILLLVGAAGGALISFGVAALMFLYGGLNLVDPQSSSGSRTPFDFVVLAAAPLAIGLIFLPAVYYSIRSLVARPAGEQPSVSLGVRLPQYGLRERLGLRGTGLASSAAVGLVYGAILLAVWIGLAALAQRLLEQPVLKWVTPLLYVLAIAIPAVFFVWIALRGINAGSPQRLWGALAAGIGLGILPAIVAELIVAFLVFIVLIVYLALNPSQLETFRQLAIQLQGTTNMDQILSMAGPLLTSPVVVLLALFFFSGLSPLIEETAKSLATWTVFDRLASPAQGFAVGAVSGAAFGLVESLLVSATPDSSWMTTLLVRGASTMMHIMGASLTGLGIGQFRTTRRILPLLGMYLAAMGLHGLWNASVVAITAGTVRSAMSSPAPDPAGVIFAFAGGAVLVLLCLAIPVALWAINWHFRAVAVPAAAAPSADGYVQPALLLHEMPVTPPVAPDESSGTSPANPTNSG